MCFVRILNNLAAVAINTTNITRAILGKQWFRKVLQLTQILVISPLLHLSARLLAVTLHSAILFAGRWLTTIWTTRPSYRCASKQLFHSGNIVFFFWTSCTPAPENSTDQSQDQTSTRHMNDWKRLVLCIVTSIQPRLYKQRTVRAL